MSFNVITDVEALRSTMDNEVFDSVMKKARGNTITKAECDISFDLASKVFFHFKHLKDITNCDYEKKIDLCIGTIQKVFENRFSILNQMSMEEADYCLHLWNDLYDSMKNREFSFVSYITEIYSTLQQTNSIVLKSNKSFSDIYSKLIFIFNKYTDYGFMGVSEDESRNDKICFMTHLYYVIKMFEISKSNIISQPSLSSKDFVNTGAYIIHIMDICFKLFHYLDDSSTESDFHYLLDNYIMFSFDLISEYFFHDEKMTDYSTKKTYYSGIFNCIKFVEKNIHMMYQEDMTHELFVRMSEMVKAANIISKSNNTIFIDNRILLQIQTMLNHTIEKKRMNPIDHYFIRIRCSYMLLRIQKIQFESLSDFTEKRSAF